MSASEKPACGRWMPRKRAYCARKLDHKGDCRTAEALADERQRTTERRKTARRRGVRLQDDPAVRARWNRSHKFNRFGITEAQFNQMLAAQDRRCGICRERFMHGRICIDHDHACCPVPPNGISRSCGKCVRGLLCVRCNTWLGWLEKYGGLVGTYLSSTAGGLVE